MKKKLMFSSLAFSLLFAATSSAQLGNLKKGLEDKAKAKAQEQKDKELKELKDKENLKTSAGTGSGSTGNSTPASSGTTSAGSSSASSGTSSSGNTSAVSSGTSSASGGNSSSSASSAKKPSPDDGPKDMSKERSDQLAALNANYPHPRFYVLADGKNMYNISYAQWDNGYTMEMHRHNPAKIVFGGSKIDIAGPDSQLRTEFSSDDKSIFAEVFLEASPRNYVLYFKDKPAEEQYKRPNEIGSIVMYASVDGDSKLMVYKNNSKTFSAEFAIPVYGKEIASYEAFGGDRTYGDLEKLKGLMSYLDNVTEGKHEVHLEVWAGDGGGQSSETAIAAGDFTYVQKNVTSMFTPADGANYTKDDGVTTEMGKNNKGKIVFSKTRLDANSTQAQVVNSFDITDPMYGRAYLGTSMVNYKVFLGGPEPQKNTPGSFYIYIQVDDQEKQMLTQSSMDGELSKKTNFNILLRGTGNDGLGTDESYIALINALPEGEHKIRLEVWAGNGFTSGSMGAIATGSFTLVKKAGAKASLGRTFASITPGMVNPTMEAQALKSLSERGKAAGWEEKFNAVKIMSSDWETIRNELTSVIEGRIVEVMALLSFPDGHCAVQQFTMWEDYTGSGYSNTMIVNGLGARNEVDCK